MGGSSEERLLPTCNTADEQPYRAWKENHTKRKKPAAPATAALSHNQEKKPPHDDTQSEPANLPLNSNVSRKPPDPNPRKKKSPKHCATRCFCYSNIQRTFSQQYDDAWASEFEFKNSTKENCASKEKNLLMPESMCEACDCSSIEPKSCFFFCMLLTKLRSAPSYTNERAPGAGVVTHVSAKSPITLAKEVGAPTNIAR